jgi:hypothetical protein
MQNPNQNQDVHSKELDAGLTELMKAHLDTVAGGLAGHNSWRQTSVV